MVCYHIKVRNGAPSYFMLVVCRQLLERWSQWCQIAEGYVEVADKHNGRQSTEQIQVALEFWNLG